MHEQANTKNDTITQKYTYILCVHLSSAQHSRDIHSISGIGPLMHRAIGVLTIF